MPKHFQGSFSEIYFNNLKKVIYIHIHQPTNSVSLGKKNARMEALRIKILSKISVHFAKIRKKIVFFVSSGKNLLMCEIVCTAIRF